jgi:hypothetical protein
MLTKMLMTAFLAVCLVIPTGCSEGVELFLLNNTKSDVEIIVQTKSFQIRPQAGLGIPPSGEPPSLVLRVNGNLLTYSFEGKMFLPSKRSKGIARFFLQLEESGEIFAINPAPSKPVEHLPSQPRGFPVTPIRPE